MQVWTYLGFAILLDVFGTLSLKLAGGFARPFYTGATLLCYLVSFLLLSHALKGLSVGMVYAVWSGVGTALIALAGFLVFHEPLGWLKVASLALIAAGIAGLCWSEPLAH